MAKKKITFEDGMDQLEQMVRQLERGELTLEESYKTFEKAHQLLTSLEGILAEGDARIRVLTEQGEQKFDADTEVSE